MARVAVAAVAGLRRAQAPRHACPAARASAAPTAACSRKRCSPATPPMPRWAGCCSSAATGTRRNTSSCSRRARERYRTVDIDPAKARFGAPDHVIAPMQEIDRHFAPGSIDVIVANGVYGFGIDDRAGLCAAFAAARAVLRPGGTLVLGWNDVPALAPFDPEARGRRGRLRAHRAAIRSAPGARRPTRRCATPSTPTCAAARAATGVAGRAHFLDRRQPGEHLVDAVLAQRAHAFAASPAAAAPRRARRSGSGGAARARSPSARGCRRGP